MAYTVDRLNHAKRLFIQAKNQRYSATDNHKYTLRKRNARSVASFSSTWIDDDGDDTYHPGGRNTRKKKRTRPDDNSSGISPKRQKATQSLIVTMNVMSDAGKAYLSTLPIYQDEDPDTEDVQCKLANDLLQMSEEAPAMPTEYVQEDQTSQKVLEIKKMDPKKGCTTCWALGVDCLLAKDVFAYPCSFCRDNDMDCELYDPPEWKRACESCRKSKRQCSYAVDAADHNLPCKACRAEEAYCVAGPAKCKPESATANVPTPDGVSLGPGLGLASSPTTIAAAASSPNKNSGGGVGKSTPSQLSRPTRTIQTSFAHPINFTYDPPADGTNPCHWCSNFTYGIVGLGKQTVEVTRSARGEILEIKGGHVAQGREPSRMCVTCALERIHIMRCSGHRIVPLKGYTADSFDFDAAYRSLSPDSAGLGFRQINPWCSLCPNPALYGCSAIQTRNKFLELVRSESRDAQGCGLLVCESCEVLMRKFAGDLRKVVKKNEELDAEFGSRADVVFLLPDNDLYQCYTRS
ncbi:hypothetical protein FE257_000955 [Aspergillus nanangensis]|uniref:Zn(2)-C6 fungal-type domain-containing protein n=1 Tax=Aspergillus nanangensis TaxID=2582783 RepID=A0AAD4CEQ0_ASPNN|nr:hypothetical protein FE257_000955 [Aspergillus nanangensis]